MCRGTGSICISGSAGIDNDAYLLLSGVQALTKGALRAIVIVLVDVPRARHVGTGGVDLFDGGDGGVEGVVLQGKLR